MTDKKPIREYDRFIVRMPDGMKESLAFRAGLKNQSINSEIVEILAKHIKFGRHGEIDAIRTRLGMLRAIQANYRKNLNEVEEKIEECNSILERLRSELANKD